MELRKMELRISDTVVISYGRFNPPTIGHENLIKKIISESNERKADYFLIPTKRNVDSNNPLSYDRKIYWLNRLFPTIPLYITDSNTDSNTNFIDILTELNKKYKNLVYICGSDRQKEFYIRIMRYNTGGFKQLYNFNDIRIVSSGNRLNSNNINKDDLQTVSASKVRNFVSNCDTESFYKYIPGQLSDKIDLYEELRNSLYK